MTYDQRCLQVAQDIAITEYGSCPNAEQALHEFVHLTKVVIHMQAEAIREYAIKCLQRTPSAVESWLKQNGYIPEKEGEQ